MNKIYLSKGRIAELRKELRKLKADVLKHHEDEHENIKMSYREAVSFDIVIGAKEARVRKLKEILKNVGILPNRVENEKVVLGSHIELKDEEGNANKYRLVHPIEADPSENLLSVESPLGKVLLNKCEGDKVVFNGSEVEIITIE
jgi:transcription elongation GreA/GreB family factor